MGLSTLQKCTIAIRILGYEVMAVDDYVRIGETTTRTCLEYFVHGVVEIFGNEYLRRPTAADLHQLLSVAHERGFPVMIGTQNDINVLDKSPVFGDIFNGTMPPVDFRINGNKYDMPYYLIDGIYPKYDIFVKSISRPQGSKAQLFASYQERYRKDIECIWNSPSTFCNCQRSNTCLLTKFWCIIMRNMIVEDEGN
ncbi:hypothetical protein LIER_41019 [Lithospermum erythrorhizon]|uniref:Uncharacterized protein n=1 Tax=Lithospermum erythrorhizon TaxID=34254 RepID=A0AAV3R6B1_LITER